MRPAALPARSDERGADGFPEPDVRIADDELHALQAARDEAAQERGPARAVLGRDDVDAENFPASVGVHAERHEKRDVAAMHFRYAEGEPSLRRQSTRQATQPAEPKTQSKGFCDNPLYDLSKMDTAVEHANQVRA